MNMEESNSNNMKRFCLYLILLSTTACQSRFFSQDELIAFASNEENGLKKSVDLGKTKVEVMYRPTDLMVQQETGIEAVNTSHLEALRRKYNNYLYFILSLSNNDKEALHQTNGLQYSELVQTLSFRMNDYVSLTTSAQDTIPVGDFILNRTYGLSSSTDLLFVFNKEKAVGKEWVQFNLNELGLGIGNQRFRFKAKDLQNVPRLKFNMLAKS
jgi:hypothetical protein